MGEQTDGPDGRPGVEPDEKPGREPGRWGASTGRLVFGDPLDRQTADDTDAGWGERPGGGGGRGLDWYLSQRPPHHGD
ncbi:hypothetical protein [Kitasatospora sp. DSM 101779]|uniref:hypothetical protein n=1 Tax=Kitasatospora sp. DSM 101779 TaxID=2853165 RepID=UPI0021D9AB57|nr:hypothetical protein [Kitasatospora sp. DSM 101779]MCU7823216.1 hypothetical protein [Kitasatospora sp. DSM 101779]